MKITFTNQYLADFKLLPRDDKEAVIAALELFVDEPLNSSLANHSLSGRLKGKRAISAGPDLRIVFRADDEFKSVTLIAVGNHNKVYRR